VLPLVPVPSLLWIVLLEASMVVVSALLLEDWRVLLVRDWLVLTSLLLSAVVLPVTVVLSDVPPVGVIPVNPVFDDSPVAVMVALEL